MPTFCYEIGYAGYAKFADKPVLATDGSFQIDTHSIFSTGLYGAKHYNATESSAVVPDYPQTSVNIGFELTSNGIFGSMGNSITTNRYNSNDVEVYPNGTAGYKSKMYTQSLQFAASQDSLVTGSISLKGANIDNISSSKNSNISTGSNLINTLASTYISVFPYYGTKFNTTSFVSKDVINWSLTSSQQIQFLKECDAKPWTTTFAADYAVIGLIKVNGNVQCIGLSQLLNSKDAMFQLNNTVTLDIHGNSGTNYKITTPNMKCSNISSSLQTGANLINTQFDFTVLAAKGEQLVTYS